MLSMPLKYKITISDTNIKKKYFYFLDPMQISHAWAPLKQVLSAVKLAGALLYTLKGV
jgi:hypothetical protein